MYFASSSESVGKDMLKHANFQYADKTDTATTCMPAQNRRCGCGCECGLVDLYRLGGVMGENFHWRNVKCNWGHRHCHPPYPPPLSSVPLSMKLPDCVEVWCRLRLLAGPRGLWHISVSWN